MEMTSRATRVVTIGTRPSKVIYSVHSHVLKPREIGSETLIYELKRTRGKRPVCSGKLDFPKREGEGGGGESESERDLSQTPHRHTVLSVSVKCLSFERAQARAY